MKKVKRVIITAAVGTVLAAGVAVASIEFLSMKLDTVDKIIILDYEINNLPIERLAERDAVDSEYRQYGLISTHRSALIHYWANYNYKSNKCEYKTDENGEPRITGDYLDFRDAEIVYENGLPASKIGLKPGTPVIVECDIIFESYPAQMHCTKVTILK